MIDAVDEAIVHSGKMMMMMMMMTMKIMMTSMITVEPYSHIRKPRQNWRLLLALFISNV
jgi:hypothetical protein